MPDENVGGSILCDDAYETSTEATEIDATWYSWIVSDLLLPLFLASAVALASKLYFRTGGGGADVRVPEYVVQKTAPATSKSAAGTSGEGDDDGFPAKMKRSGRRMVVFYGSQTGTAEEFAVRLAKEGQSYGFRGIAVDPEESDMDDLRRLGPEVGPVLGGSCLAVFCLATYGEGDPTDNAMGLFTWLQENAAGGDSIADLNFAVFGLGNKTYEHYNEMAKFTDKKLHEMGANRVHELGMGDDDANIEEDFVTWKQAFWESVCKYFDLTWMEDDDFSSRHYDFKVYDSTYPGYNPTRLFKGEIARLRAFETQRPPFDQKNPFMAPIKVNRNLHSETSDRYCMHLELDISSARLRYDVGDHVAIYPDNQPDLVNRLIELIGADPDMAFVMVALDEDATRKMPFPCPTTVRTALTSYIEIASKPRTHVLKELASYTADEEDRKKLLAMSAGTTPEGKSLYNSWIMKDCRNIVHVLEDMPSCKPPVEHLLELLPRLQPRYYSISSSPKLHKESIHVTAVLVEYQTPTERINQGVCTSWLRPKVPKVEEAELSEGGVVPEDKSFYPKVPIFLRRSQFRLPMWPKAPIIMVGPGTGVAPFRGFIQERSWQRAQGKLVGETHLFFGCRNKDVDFIYRAELEKYAEEGTVVLHTAFSRDQPEKIYVTHLLRQQTQLLHRLIVHEKAHFYVCGDAKNMAKDVREIVLDTLVKNGDGMDINKAEAYVKEMEQNKRYSADVWS